MAGTKGTSKATVHDVFKERIEDLQKRLARLSGDGYCRTAQRAWWIPQAWIDKDVDIHDIQALEEGFDRTPINENYVDCLKDAADAGTVGDVISLKQQIDYNAAEERALRLRHSSVIRCLTHACGRRRGHCESRLYLDIEKQVADLIKAGAV